MGFYFNRLFIYVSVLSLSLPAFAQQQGYPQQQQGFPQQQQGYPQQQQGFPQQQQGYPQQQQGFPQQQQGYPQQQQGFPQQQQGYPQQQQGYPQQQQGFPQQRQQGAFNPGMQGRGNGQAGGFNGGNGQQQNGAVNRGFQPQQRRAAKAVKQKGLKVSYRLPSPRVIEESLNLLENVRSQSTAFYKTCLVMAITLKVKDGFADEVAPVPQNSEGGTAKRGNFTRMLIDHLIFGTDSPKDEKSNTRESGERTGIRETENQAQSPYDPFAYPVCEWAHQTQIRATRTIDYFNTLHGFSITGVDEIRLAEVAEPAFSEVRGVNIFASAAIATGLLYLKGLHDTYIVKNAENRQNSNESLGKMLDRANEIIEDFRLTMDAVRADEGLKEGIPPSALIEVNLSDYHLSLFSTESQPVIPYPFFPFPTNEMLSESLKELQAIEEPTPTNAKDMQELEEALKNRRRNPDLIFYSKRLAIAKGIARANPGNNAAGRAPRPARQSAAPQRGDNRGKVTAPNTNANSPDLELEDEQPWSDAEPKNQR